MPWARVSKWILPLIKSIIYAGIGIYFIYGNLKISPLYAGIIGAFFISLAIRSFLIFLINISAPHGRMPKRERYLRSSITHLFTAILFGFEGYILWRDSKLLSRFISVGFMNLIILLFFGIAAISVVISIIYFLLAIFK